MIRCLDVFDVVCEFLSQKDLIVLGDVNRGIRRVVSHHMGGAERQYLHGKLYAHDRVELAPPSQIIALGFVRSQNKLVTLVRSALVPNSLDIECALYTQTAGGDRSAERHFDVPLCFGAATSQVRFEGDRFLVCTTREGELFVFDCVLESLVSIPRGCDAFHASPDGSRFLLDLDRHFYYCDSRLGVMRHWNVPPAPPACTSSSSWLDSETPKSLELRTTLGVDQALIRFPLGNSSAAWHGFWVGGSSVLYLDEGGVSLFEPRSHRRGYTSCSLTKEFSGGDFQGLLHDCRSTVVTTSSGADIFVLLNCKSGNLYTVHQDTRARPPSVQCLPLKGLLPTKTMVRDVRVAVPHRVYAVFTRGASGCDGMLLVSSDLSVVRQVPLGRIASFAFLPEHTAIIAANTMEPGNPLLEAVEGGLGTIYSFYPPHSTTTAVVEMPSSCSAEKSWLGTGMATLRSTNGVEALSWISLAIVSVSLIWTVCALCYHGWRLHVELLFWAKVA